MVVQKKKKEKKGHKQYPQKNKLKAMQHVYLGTKNSMVTKTQKIK